MAKKYIRMIADEEEILRVVQARPTAFVLLAIVAVKAKQEGDLNDLEIGESLIEGHKSLGVTEQVYKTDKEFLVKYGFLTIKTTNKGTVMKATNKTIFITDTAKGNEQSNERVTNKQRASNEQKGEIEAPKEYGNPEINKMVSSLKLKIGIDMFADSSIERNIGKHLVGLLNKIGIEEFTMRLESVLNDDFKRKNCNRIRFVYNELKSFIPQQNSALFDLSKLS